LFAGYERLLERLAELCARQPSIVELITSGSPGFGSALAFAPFAALDRMAHRVSPGTVVFHDLRSELQDPRRGLRPAALVRAAVVSAPRAGRVTLDAGSKALGADAGTPIAQVLGRPGWRPRGPSEEHLPVDLDAGVAARHGERVWLVPRHVCTTVNLAREALLIDSRAAPRVVPIAAGGHRPPSLGEWL
jgi:D-serine deaminase-like pyridoxal phosphate-dependent protein